MSLPSQAELQALLDYDPLTGELTWKNRPLSMFKSIQYWSMWNKRYAGTPAFTAVTTKGYHNGAINNVSYRKCRVVFKLYHGIDADCVDHIDGDYTNDRIANLRDVTNAENHKNMKKPLNNTSGTMGVCWDAGKGKWMAHIKLNGVRKHLGRYHDINDAIAARKAAEIQYDFHPNHGR